MSTYFWFLHDEFCQMTNEIKRQKISFEFKANLKFNIRFEIYQSAIGSSELFHQYQQFVDRPFDRAAVQLSARSAFARARRLRPSAVHQLTGSAETKHRTVKIQWDPVTEKREIVCCRKSVDMFRVISYYQHSATAVRCRTTLWIRWFLFCWKSLSHSRLDWICIKSCSWPKDFHKIKILFPSQRDPNCPKLMPPLWILLSHMIKIQM